MAAMNDPGPSKIAVNGPYRTKYGWDQLSRYMSINALILNYGFGQEIDMSLLITLQGLLTAGILPRVTCDDKL